MLYLHLETLASGGGACFLVYTIVRTLYWDTSYEVLNDNLSGPVYSQDSQQLNHCVPPTSFFRVVNRQTRLRVYGVCCN